MPVSTLYWFRLSMYVLTSFSNAESSDLPYLDSSSLIAVTVLSSDQFPPKMSLFCFALANECLSNRYLPKSCLFSSLSFTTAKTSSRDFPTTFLELLTCLFEIIDFAILSAFRAWFTWFKKASSLFFFASVSKAISESSYSRLTCVSFSLIVEGAFFFVSVGFATAPSSSSSAPSLV